MLAVVAPGQGSQKPGLLSPWLELPKMRELLTWWSAVADIDLIRLGTVADSDEIRDTANAQPLLVATGLVTGLAMFNHPSDAIGKVAVMAGHSVGEITAAAASRVITAEAAMVLVRERGRAMARAASLTPTGMSAVIGGDREAVLASLKKFDLIAANENGASQIVAAGELANLARLSAEPPQGSRVIPLEVAGAFHTHFMSPAVNHLAEITHSMSVRDPWAKVISNRDGAVIHHGRTLINRLVNQISTPVRWDRCMETIKELGVTAVIEVAPGGTLTGLLKRTLPELELLAVKTPEDLPAAHAMIERHRVIDSLANEPTWRLVVSPFTGHFELDGDIDELLGRNIAPGELLGRVSNRSESIDIVSEHGGTIIEFLVENNDPVSPGQPILRLHPASESAQGIRG
jgi:[acyl-carrier-protein] S-malonyltransferase